MNWSRRNFLNKLISFNLYVRRCSIRLIEWRHRIHNEMGNEEDGKKLYNGSHNQIDERVCVRASARPPARSYMHAWYHLFILWIRRCLSPFFRSVFSKWAPKYQFRLSSMLCSYYLFMLDCRFFFFCTQISILPNRLYSYNMLYILHFILALLYISRFQLKRVRIWSRVE